MKDSTRLIVVAFMLIVLFSSIASAGVLGAIWTGAKATGKGIKWVFWGTKTAKKITGTGLAIEGIAGVAGGVVGAKNDGFSGAVSGAWTGLATPPKIVIGGVSAVVTSSKKAAENLSSSLRVEFLKSRQGSPVYIISFEGQPNYNQYSIFEPESDKSISSRAASAVSFFNSSNSEILAKAFQNYAAAHQTQASQEQLSVLIESEKANLMSILFQEKKIRDVSSLDLKAIFGSSDLGCGTITNRFTVCKNNTLTGRKLAVRLTKTILEPKGEYSLAYEIVEGSQNYISKLQGQASIVDDFESATQQGNSPLAIASRAQNTGIHVMQNIADGYNRFWDKLSPQDVSLKFGEKQSGELPLIAAWNAPSTANYQNQSLQGYLVKIQERLNYNGPEDPQEHAFFTKGNTITLSAKEDVSYLVNVYSVFGPETSAAGSGEIDASKLSTDKGYFLFQSRKYSDLTPIQQSESLIVRLNQPSIIVEVASDALAKPTKTASGDHIYLAGERNSLTVGIDFLLTGQKAFVGKDCSKLEGTEIALGPDGEAEITAEQLNSGNFSFTPFKASGFESRGGIELKITGFDKSVSFTVCQDRGTFDDKGALSKKASDSKISALEKVKFTAENKEALSFGEAELAASKDYIRVEVKNPNSDLPVFFTPYNDCESLRKELEEDIRQKLNETSKKSVEALQQNYGVAAPETVAPTLLDILDKGSGESQGFSMADTALLYTKRGITKVQDFWGKAKEIFSENGLQKLKDSVSVPLDTQADEIKHNADFAQSTPYHIAEPESSQKYLPLRKINNAKLAGSKSTFKIYACQFYDAARDDEFLVTAESAVKEIDPSTLSPAEACPDGSPPNAEGACNANPPPVSSQSCTGVLDCVSKASKSMIDQLGKVFSNAGS